MGWLDKINAKKDKVPDIFKDKNEDDILKMMADAAADKAERTKLEAKVAEQDTAVASIQSEFDKVKERLASADAARNRQPDKNNTDETVDFVSEPERSFGKLVGPVANIAIQNSAITSRMLAQQQLDNADLSSGGKTMEGRLFRAWGPEIDAQSKKYQAVQLVSPDAWIGIFYYVKGLHSDELRDPEVRKKKYNFLEPTQSNVNTNSDNKDKPAADQLTDQEKHIADKMNVTHENYLKRKKAMTMVNA